jgi:hypothetical protein
VGVVIGEAATYEAFLERKAQLGAMDGFAPRWMPGFLFDFQAALVDWAVRKGRAAILADCGLGKAPMALVWAENVVRRTGGRVLILTPLAVGAQMLAEAAKFGVEAHRSGDGRPRPNITIANYERLHLFDPTDFAGVVCDESSILKAFDGVRRALVTEFLRRTAYRLLCTATAAPNDYVELGTSSEALGDLGHVDMLNRFFKNDLNNSSTGRGYLGARNEWRLKPHAAQPFWRWVCSWARAIRTPADLGYDDARFVLPALVERETVVTARTPRPGQLFDLAAVGFQEEREVTRRTIRERCDAAAATVADTGASAVVWCHLNAEGDLLERLIPGAVQVSGADADDIKEERFAAFASGQARVLVCKPKIGAWGLNWQHCAHVVYFPSHSYESYYQAVRRCWRFGQTRPVVVDLVRTDGDAAVLANLQRKAAQADRMFTDLVAHMTDARAVDRERGYAARVEVPRWL